MGGNRKNSGRKPVEDPRKQVCIYPQESRIEKLGIETVKTTALNAIEKEYKKKKIVNE